MRVFLLIFLLFLSQSVYAATVLQDEQKQLDIYGNIHLYLGYGHGEAPAGVDLEAGKNMANSMMYGVQDNSDVGIRFNIGKFKSNIEIGLNEKTFVTQSNCNNNMCGLGVRYFWGEYDFGQGGALLLGKADTLTSMGMFFSNYFDNNEAMNGFGGSTSSTRRIQVRYTNMGFSFAVMEDDVVPDAVNNASDSYQNSSGQYELYYKDNGKKVPRLAIGYTYNNPKILAKIAATFSAGKGEFQNTTSNAGQLKYLMGYGITAGIKPVFLDNKFWFSIVARFGMNEDIYGEGRTIYNGGIYENSINILSPFEIKIV